MGCFSRPIDLVSDTRMFITELSAGRQLLVYEMRLWTTDDVAMVLPLPVPEDTTAEEIRFVSVPGQGSFFNDLAEGFSPTGSRDRGGDSVEPGKFGKANISYLPDAAGLVKAFANSRLSESVLRQLRWPSHAGFAVLRMKKSDGVRYQVGIDFPRGDPRTLFFPLAQVHDAGFTAVVTMDHTLYCQQSGAEPTRHVDGWKTSAEPSKRFLGAKRKGIADLERHVYQQTIRGERPNRDLYLTAKTLGRTGAPAFA